MRGVKKGYRIKCLCDRQYSGVIKGKIYIVQDVTKDGRFKFTDNGYYYGNDGDEHFKNLGGGGPFLTTLQDV
tara:strand:- start:2108 stop:2323 length:216 start_codon:yes stop_codon:yes gene_type:complete